MFAWLTSLGALSEDDFEKNENNDQVTAGGAYIATILAHKYNEVIFIYKKREKKK